MSGQQNIEIVRGVYKFWDRQDWSVVPELFDPDVVLDLSRNIFNPGVYRGYAGLEEYASAVNEVWDEFRIVPVEIFDAGDAVITEVMICGTGRGSGADVEMKVFNVWTLHGSKVVRIVGGYRDRSEALEAAGTSKRIPNVENLRAQLEVLDLEAWRRGEGDMSFLDPNVTYEDTVLPDHVGEKYRGHDGVARATERWLESYEQLTIELEQIVGADDRFVSIHRVRGRARYTGIEADGTVAYLWTFRDGKVIHFRSYRDPDEALEAAGLQKKPQG